MKKIQLIIQNLLVITVLGSVLFYNQVAFAAYSSGTVVTLTNSERSRAGLGSLTVNSSLTSAATAKANDMLAKGYFAHTSPDGRTPWDFISVSGYSYTYAGENLAIGYTDASELMTAWMNSATHRANILNSNFREIGVAVVSGKYNGVDTIVVAQEFGSPLGKQENTSQSQSQNQQAAGENTENVNTTATPTPVNSVSSTPLIQINKAKSAFQPVSIFQNEETEIKVVLTGEAKTLEAQIGDLKANLLENGTISKSGSETTYTLKVKVLTAGKFDVVINSANKSGVKSTENLGSLEVKPAVIANQTNTDNPENKGFVAGFKEIVQKGWVIILFVVIILGVITFLIVKNNKFSRLAKFGMSAWDL